MPHKHHPFDRLTNETPKNPHRYRYVCSRCGLSYRDPDDSPTRIQLFSPLLPANTITELCPTCADIVIPAVKQAIISASLMAKSADLDVIRKLAKDCKG